MGECIFIIGGARSGKSTFAQELAEKAGSPEKYFLATCPVFDLSDADMTSRVEKHKQLRQGKGWQTVEEEINLAQAMANIPENATVLIDCLTLWISNLLHDKGIDFIGEDEIVQRIEDLLEYCRKRSGNVFFVSGEVGCSVIPENALARHFRDLVGRCNQTVAGAVNKVFLVNCGIPTQIKG